MCEVSNLIKEVSEVWDLKSAPAEVLDKIQLRVKELLDKSNESLIANIAFMMWINWRTYEEIQALTKK